MLRRRPPHYGLAFYPPPQRAPQGVHGGDEGGGDACGEEGGDRVVGAGRPVKGPEEGAESELKKAGEVEEEDDKSYMKALPRAGKRFLRVAIPEGYPVIGGPAEKEQCMVDEHRVLVNAHDGEERVEDLVAGFHPVLSLRVLLYNAIENAYRDEDHEQEDGRAGHGPD